MVTVSKDGISYIVKDEAVAEYIAQGYTAEGKAIADEKPVKKPAKKPEKAAKK